VILVRNGAVIPHIKLAQSTSEMDWSKLDLVVYAAGSPALSGWVCLPETNALRSVSVVSRGSGFQLVKDPFQGKVSWRILPSAKRSR
ncbi:MAG TPA: hypothetical protein PLI30_07810, partial [Petrimonas sp.]|nr:hypothetical protein [Petrimonas sp.]